MNGCTKFHCNLSFPQNQSDISIKPTNVNRSVWPEEKSDDRQKSLRFVLSEP